MVCKEFEELCAKFGDLSPHKRIDIMCGMLRLCLAPELRFIGSVVEDLAKKDYHFLREHEIKANRQSDLLHYYTCDERTLRNAMALNLALLHSWNTTCANTIFDILETNMKRAFQVSLSIDSEDINVILLVLTMAMNHPAFTFHQRDRIFNYYKRVEQQLEDVLKKVINVSTGGGPLLKLGRQSPELIRSDVLQVPPAVSPQPGICDDVIINIGQGEEPVIQKDHICNIELVKGERSNKRKNPECKLRVTWNNGQTTYVTKSVQDFKEFQKEFVKLFPKDGDASRNDRKFLILVNPSSGQRDREGAHEEVISNYIKQLLTFPKDKLDSDHVIQFFKGGKSGRSQGGQASSTHSSSKSVTMVTSSSSLSAKSPPSQQSVCKSTSQTSPQPTSIESIHSIDPVSVIHSPPTLSPHIDDAVQQDDIVGNDTPPSISRLSQSSPSHSPSAKHFPSDGRNHGNAHHHGNSPPLSEQELTHLFTKLNLQKPECLQRLPWEELMSMEVDDLVNKGLCQAEAVKIRQEMDLASRDKLMSLPNGLSMPCVLMGNETSPEMSPCSVSGLYQPGPLPLSSQRPIPPFILHAAQPTGLPHMIYPAVPTRLTRDSSPTGSDCSSPPHSPLPHRTINKMSDSSSDENDKGRTRSPLTDMNRRSLHRSLDDGRMDEIQRGGVLHIGSGYQSDPSGICHPQIYPSIPAPCKAQPAHTNLGIPPKNVISMPPDSAGILFGKRPAIFPVGVAMPRSDTSVASVMTTTITTATPAHRLIYPIRPHGGLRSNLCTVTNTTAVTMTSQPINTSIPMAHMLTPTANKGSTVPSESNAQQQQTLVQESSSTKTVPSHGGGVPSNNAVPSHNASPLPGSHNSAGATASRNLSCTSCGCPGHNHVTYPYYHPVAGLLPGPLWHVPMAPTPTSNGIIPTPHIIPPGFTYQIPNGITPDMLLNHHNANMLASSSMASLYSGGPMVGGPPLLQRVVSERKEKPRRVTCHNCGSTEHNASECNDNSMESISAQTVAFYGNYPHAVGNRVNKVPSQSDNRNRRGAYQHINKTDGFYINRTYNGNKKAGGRYVNGNHNAPVSSQFSRMDSRHKICVNDNIRHAVHVYPSGFFRGNFHMRVPPPKIL
ncbi:hypothetical protein FSP39_019124 [Pinctada imbricata]|uniref:Uncharacterized protein n=1 Tax=Pinctada imbricata TaxID=66713 RepID=A0AA89BXN5_PINIB|nr:hypothetical protein FSP39_019124 [Pinctada imbricata]